MTAPQLQPRSTAPTRKRVPPARRAGARLSLAVAAAAALAFPAAALARIVPVGPVFQVNTYTPGRQEGHQLAALPDRGFVVVWRSEGQDGDRTGVFGRRFGADGQPATAEFQANTFPGYQSFPDVAAAPDGSFLVVWDSTSGHIRGQRFDANASRLGSEFEVDGEDLETYGPFDPLVAATPGGDFVVTWSADTDGYAKRGRVLDAGGLPKGPPFAITEQPLDIEFHTSSMTTRPDGSFVVVWEAHVPDVGPTMMGRLLDPNGHPLTPQFDIGLSTYHLCADTCSDGQGRFVLAWDGEPRPEVLEDVAVYRRYDSAARPLTPELEIAPRTEGIDQGCASLSCTQEGNFIAAFDEACDVDVCGFFGITGRYFPEGEAERAEEFRIGVPAFGRGAFGVVGGGIRIAALTDTSFALVWVQCPTRDDCDLFGQLFSRSGPAPCQGDCNADGAVNINDLITAVNVALNPSANGTVQCLAADSDLSGSVLINELVAAVRRAIEGCG